MLSLQIDHCNPKNTWYRLPLLELQTHRSNRHFPEVDRGLTKLNLFFNSEIFPPALRCFSNTFLSSSIFLKMAAPFEFSFISIFLIALMLAKV